MPAHPGSHFGRPTATLHRSLLPVRQLSHLTRAVTATTEAATGTLQYTNTGGKFGGALYLDGNSTLGTVSGLFPTGVPTGSNAYTVACFVKADTGGSGNGGWIGYGLDGGTGLANNFRLNGGYTSVWNYWWNRDLGATVPNSGNLSTGVALGCRHLGRRHPQDIH